MSSFTTLLAANASAFAYESTYERIQWEQRGTDTQYCLDITDANGNIAYGLQAIACGEGLHSYSAASLNLAAGNYQWKVWSPNGYGQTGFEGAFQVGAANSPLAVGSQLYANNCAACHGNDSSRSRSGISRTADPVATRNAINGNRGGMGYLSFLSDTELANIAAYIQNPNPVVRASTPSTVQTSSVTAQTPVANNLPNNIPAVNDDTDNNDIDNGFDNDNNDDAEGNDD